MNETKHRSRAASAAAALAVITALATVGVVGLAAVAAPPSTEATGTVAISSGMHQHGNGNGDAPGTEHGRAASVTKQVGLYTAMAHLWAQHMEWTYATVIAFVEDSPALQPTIDRLLQNQADIGNAIEPFYGADAAGQLTALLEEHIVDAVPVLTAAKAGDSAALQTAVAAWYANAEEIGGFLASANPHWDEADMREMMRMHITQTIAYATDALTGDYVKAIADYGIAEQHMNEMADMLSAGLIQQFPKQFR